MKSKDRFFVRVLEYAYEKGEFTNEQIETDLKIETPQDRALFQGLFRAGTDNNPELIIYTRRNEVNYFMLSRTGEELALDYFELKEARASSRNAIRLATASMVIATVTGLLQVITQIYPEETRALIGCLFR